MNKVFLLLILTLSSFSFVVAEEGEKVLQCSNSIGNVALQICGVKGCPAVVTYNGTTTTYNMKRVRNQDRSLTYSPRAGSKAKCTIVVSALRFGIRRLNSITCAKKLKGAVCSFTTMTPTPVPTSTPE